MNNHLVNSLTELTKFMVMNLRRTKKNPAQCNDWREFEMLKQVQHDNFVIIGLDPII